MVFRGASLIVAVLACRVGHAADLPQRIDAAVNSGPLAQRSNIGIHVVDLKTGKALYGRNENRFFLPASNMKLFTSALALKKLGTDYRFLTRVIEMSGGDLVLAGSGDPSMNGRAYPYQPDVRRGPPLEAIEDLAGQAVSAGLTRVDGDVVGDDRLYPWDPYPPSWTQDDAVHESGAPVSALSVSDNFVTISIRPAAHAGDMAVLALSPALEYFAIDNRVITVAGAGAAHIVVSRAPGTRQILLSGNIPAMSGGVQEIAAVDDPALFAACALYDALTRHGVVVRGHPVARHRAAGDPYEEPTGVTLATRTSPPLAELLQLLDKVSENLHAELMLREVGRLTLGTGTREAGLAALSALLVSAGAAPEDSRIDDGSGLSRNDQVTPQLVTRLLSFLYRSEQRDAWIAMLPVGGQDGTLSRRLCCSSEAHAIHAKTGTLARAIALSGYAESKTQGWLAFSILVNNFTAPPASIQAWIDKIALTLVE